MQCIIMEKHFRQNSGEILEKTKARGFNATSLSTYACLVVNPITVGNLAFLFNCTPVGRTSDSIMVLT